MTPAELMKTLFPTPLEQTVDQRFGWGITFPIADVSRETSQPVVGLNFDLDAVGLV